MASEEVKEFEPVPTMYQTIQGELLAPIGVPPLHDIIYQYTLDPYPHMRGFIKEEVGEWTEKCLGLIEEDLQNAYNELAPYGEYFEKVYEVFSNAYWRDYLIPEYGLELIAPPPNHRPIMDELTLESWNAPEEVKEALRVLEIPYEIIFLEDARSSLDNAFMDVSHVPDWISNSHEIPDHAVKAHEFLQHFVLDRKYRRENRLE